MKAITLWQPWAWLIFKTLDHISPPCHVKRIETRSWNTNYRGRIAIHASKNRKIEPEIFQEIRQALKSRSAGALATKLDYLEYGEPQCMFGSVLGTVELIDCVPIEQLYGTEYDTPLERAVGDWTPGRYGWILKDPIQFKKPIPAKGSQGFWNWEADNDE